MNDSPVANTQDALTQPCPKTWNRVDMGWTLSLFGTAVGAGVLFLPINAGLSGFWPLVLLSLLILPTVYFSHLGLSRLVLSSKNPNATITDVVEEHFGVTGGRLLTVLYFCTVFPILLIYSVGITNTIDNLLTHHFPDFAIHRSLLALLLITGMLAVMNVNEHFILKVMGMLVYPLVAILVFVSLYLMPSWNFSALSSLPQDTGFFTSMWLTIPVLIFAFNFSPAISNFSRSQRLRYQDNAQDKANRILKRTSLMLFVFVMFFVFSIILTLTPDQLAQAKSQNIDILSYLANQGNLSFFAFLASLVAITAILSSFFGHYLGAREGLNSLLMTTSSKMGFKLNNALLHYLVVGVMGVSLWGIAVINPNILGLIESLIGPVIAMFLLLMPVYAINTVPALAKFKGKKRNGFVVVMGLITVSAIFYQLIVMFG